MAFLLPPSEEEFVWFVCFSSNLPLQLRHTSSRFLRFWQLFDRLVEITNSCCLGNNAETKVLICQILCISMLFHVFSQSVSKFLLSSMIKHDCPSTGEHFNLVPNRREFFFRWKHLRFRTTSATTDELWVGSGCCGRGRKLWSGCRKCQARWPTGWACSLLKQRPCYEPWAMLRHGSSSRWVFCWSAHCKFVKTVIGNPHKGAEALGLELKSNADNVHFGLGKGLCYVSGEGAGWTERN